MSARCGEGCGWCGACTAAWEGNPQEPEPCPHPIDRRISMPGLIGDGECELCHAPSWRIRAEREQRRMPLPPAPDRTKE